jgi:putative methyltransferase (TIGR04325 family)
LHHSQAINPRHMKRQLIKFAKEIAPPAALRIYQNLAGKASFSGNYGTWDEARKASGGYDSAVILNKVKDALLKVKNNEAVYERDSVLFDSIQYSWPLLAGLLWIASREGNRLNLIDFGGSLGSSYFQNRKLLSHLRELTWNIVEQRNFVECGKQYFEDEHLRFYYRIEDCLKEQHVDIILLSSVIQYLEKPYDLLQTIIENKIKYLVFDRTPFLDNGNDRITVQKVPAEIYPASYPSWFFNLDKFLKFLSVNYELITDFESDDRATIPSVFKGFIFELKNK